MIKITLNVDGMMCGMCEAHINDAIRKSFNVKKVTSSHTKKQTVILTENDLDDQKLKDAISETGYEVLGVSRETCEKKEKKGLFGRFSRT